MTKKTYRLPAWLLALCLLAALVPAPAGAANPLCIDDVEHTWGEWTHTSPTCRYPGVKVRVCGVCEQDEKEETLPATGEHVWSDWTTVTAASETAEGLAKRICTACEIEETKTLDKLAPAAVWGEWQVVKPATCAEPGQRKRVQESPNKGVEEVETIPVLSHTPGGKATENKTMPTCTEAGGYDKVVRCTVCGAALESEHHTAAATGHKWDYVADPEPTCTKPGVYKIVCKNDASHTLPDEEIPALGHKLVKLIRPWASTNPEDTEYKCERCGYQFFQSELDKSEELSNAYTGDTTFADGCYIATAVYGSYDCPQVWTLRRFRDDTLGSTWYGRAFIRAYYATSPALVEHFGDSALFRGVWRPFLDGMVERLNQNGVADTPYQDKSWR